MTKYKAPECCECISVGGETFNVDKTGHVNVPDEGSYGGLLAAHGFAPVSEKIDDQDDAEREAELRAKAEAEAKAKAEAEAEAAAKAEAEAKATEQKNQKGK